nr:MAG TPA: hypothetical protein [Caudoviricetes sp.]
MQIYMSIKSKYIFQSISKEASQKRCFSFAHFTKEWWFYGYFKRFVSFTR